MRKELLLEKGSDSELIHVQTFNFFEEGKVESIASAYYNSINVFQYVTIS